MEVFSSPRERFTPEGESFKDADGASWSRVRDREGRCATLVEFPLSSPDDVSRALEPLRSLPPSAFVPIAAGGVDGETGWLVYPVLAEELTTPGPLASADLITLGVEVATALKWALDHGVPVARLGHLWVTHDYDDEGTYRPRLVGLGVPCHQAEQDLTADLAKLLILAFIGRPAHIHVRSGEPITVELTRSRGGMLASDLTDVLRRAVEGHYERLVDLRKDLLEATSFSARPVTLDAEVSGAPDPWDYALPRGGMVKKARTARVERSPSSRRTGTRLLGVLGFGVLMALVLAFALPRDSGTPLPKPAPVRTAEAPKPEARTIPTPAIAPPTTQPEPDSDTTVDAVAPDDDTADAVLVSFDLSTVPERALIYDGEAYIGHTPFRLTVRVDRLPIHLRLTRVGFHPETLTLEASEPTPDLAHTIKLTPLKRSRPAAPLILER